MHQFTDKCTRSANIKTNSPEASLTGFEELLIQRDYGTHDCVLANSQEKAGKKKRHETPACLFGVATTLVGKNASTEFDYHHQHLSKVMPWCITLHPKTTWTSFWSVVVTREEIQGKNLGTNFCSTSQTGTFIITKDFWVTRTSWRFSFRHFTDVTLKILLLFFFFLLSLASRCFWETRSRVVSVNFCNQIAAVGSFTTAVTRTAAHGNYLLQIAEKNVKKQAFSRLGLWRLSTQPRDLGENYDAPLEVASFKQPLSFSTIYISIFLNISVSSLNGLNISSCS